MENGGHNRLGMGLKPKDIVQIDATIIVGVLLFIAIGTSFMPWPAAELFISMFLAITALIVFVFTVSAVVALFGFTMVPKIFTVTGFSIISLSPILVFISSMHECWRMLKMLPIGRI